MQDFRQLQVWRKAHELTLAIYHATALFPKEEMYGLTSQMRRACSAIPANLAEGCGRGGQVELARYVQIARGSASELEYHLLLGRDLRFLADTDHDYLSEMLTEVQKMLASFRHTVLAHTSPVSHP